MTLFRKLHTLKLHIQTCHIQIMQVLAFVQIQLFQIIQTHQPQYHHLTFSCSFPSMISLSHLHFSPSNPFTKKIVAENTGFFTVLLKIIFQVLAFFFPIIVFCQASILAALTFQPSASVDNTGIGATLITSAI
jgi:hypothetical protein